MLNDLIILVCLKIMIHLDDEEEEQQVLTSELALAPDFDTQHAVAAAAALIHLGLSTVPGLSPSLEHLPCLLHIVYLHQKTHC